MGKCIIIRGGGDIATGVIQKFHRAGFNVLILETQTPTAIRRSVALCEAAYDGIKTVEDCTCHKISGLDELKDTWKKGIIPLIIDPDGNCINKLKPSAVIDAIIAKRNTGTAKNMADITIALGPGYIAGVDVNAVIETNRGHDLGRLILKGQAAQNTGVPGEIAGESKQRVIHASFEGIIKHTKSIGSIVENGEVLFTLESKDPGGASSAITEVTAPIGGLLRGLIRNGIKVSKGLKIADIDPRNDVDYNKISDKARCIGGATLEAYFFLHGTYGEA